MLYAYIAAQSLGCQISSIHADLDQFPSETKAGAENTESASIAFYITAYHLQDQLHTNDMLLTIAVETALHAHQMNTYEHQRALLRVQKAADSNAET